VNLLSQYKRIELQLLTILIRCNNIVIWQFIIGETRIQCRAQQHVACWATGCLWDIPRTEWYRLFRQSGLILSWFVHIFLIGLLQAKKCFSLYRGPGFSSHLACHGKGQANCDIFRLDLISLSLYTNNTTMSMKRGSCEISPSWSN
jgi:hypothetical protein